MTIQVMPVKRTIYVIVYNSKTKYSKSTANVTVPYLGHLIVVFALESIPVQRSEFSGHLILQVGLRQNKA